MRCERYTRFGLPQVVRVVGGEQCGLTQTEARHPTTPVARNVPRGHSPLETAQRGQSPAAKYRVATSLQRAHSTSALVMARPL